MVVGPYKSYPLADGIAANLYLLRYDKHGRLLSPETYKLLIEEVSRPGITDVFVFSHGWNNTFDEASKRYASFIDGYMAQRAQFDLSTPAGYRPVLVGVIWPSTSFVMPWERGPKIAAAPGEDSDEAEEMTRLLTDELDADDSARFAELVDGGHPMGIDEARAAAALMIDTIPGDGDEDGRTGKPSVNDVVDAWMSIAGGPPAPPTDPDDFGIAADDGAGTGSLSVAGLAVDPRDLLRMGTVWTMKARAGTVGAYGVSSLVHLVLNMKDSAEASAPRLHLVGHSFGAKVVLSSLAIGDAPRRKVRSILLLEPAINRWCFAPTVIGTGRPGAPGGYHIALARSELPIFSTFSMYDHPLHDVFHLVVRGAGELQIAAFGDSDRYGALGGYGPNGLDDMCQVLPALEAGSAHYAYADTARVVAIDGGAELADGAAIKGHGDVSNPATWWALHELTRAGGAG